MVKAFSLKNKNIIVTGGATGLGLAMTNSLIACGAHVIIVNSRSFEAASSNLKHLNPDSYTYYSHDIREHDEAESFIKKIEYKHPIYALINNAGNHLKKATVDTSIQDFQNILDVHVLGSFALSKAVLPYMQVRNEGCILFIASMTSYIGLPYVLAYSASKSAYMGMVRSLCSEYGAEGIRVNGVAPGWIETELFNQIVKDDPQRREKILSRTPAHCFGKTEDVGWTVAFLCSPAAKFINGTIIPVDGGALIGF